MNVGSVVAGWLGATALLLATAGASGAVIDGTSAGVIGFEPPGYLLGTLPAPWTTSTYSVPAVTDSIPYAGAQCLSIPESSNGSGWATHPVSIAPTGVFTVNAKIRTPDFYPGNNDPGFITQAAFYAREASGQVTGAVFDTRKPSGAPLVPENRELYLVGAGAGAWTLDGYFLPGAWHDVSMTFDWTASTWTVSVTRPDSVSYSQSGTTSGLALTELYFSGPGYSFTGAAMVTRFDSVAYTPEPATLGILALGGLALIRRRRAA